MKLKTQKEIVNEEFSVPDAIQGIDAGKVSVALEARGRWMHPKGPDDMRDTLGEEILKGRVEKAVPDDVLAKKKEEQAAINVQVAEEEAKRSAKVSRINGDLAGRDVKMRARSLCTNQIDGLRDITESEQDTADYRFGQDFRTSADPSAGQPVAIAYVFCLITGAKVALPFAEKALARIEGELSEIEARLAQYVKDGDLDIAKLQISAA